MNESSGSITSVIRAIETFRDSHKTKYPPAWGFLNCLLSPDYCQIK